MYPASSTFKDYIKRNTVTFSWHGNIVDIEGNSYIISSENIVQNTGTITRRCSSDKLSIGTACASELEMDLYLDVNRYKLFGAVVTLNFALEEDTVTELVPMGIYTISECTQSNGRLNIIAYDNMVKFDDVKYTEHLDIKLPFEWLTEMCTACGVTLGSTATQIAGLPNGLRKTGLASVTSDIQSWRDVLLYLCSYLGSYAYIGRDGKLYITTYRGNSVDTIPASFRYSSDLSDYRTTYNGLTAIYKEGGLQEYVQNSNDEEDGLVLDIGVNPFLQFSDETNRVSALQEIIDAWSGIYYVPYEADIPIIPIYDPGDVITFTGNQAGQYDTGAITEVTYSIGGRMHIQCVGDNPRLTETPDRITKSIAGLSSEYSNGATSGSKNFWLLQTENNSDITVGNTKTLVAQIDWDQSVDIQRMGFMFCCEANLTATSLISILITVDDSENYEFNIGEEKALKGKRPFSRNCGFRVVGKGSHSAKVYMTVTDSKLKWSDLV